MGNLITSSINKSYLDQCIASTKEDILAHNNFIIANESQLAVANILLVSSFKRTQFSIEDINYVRTQLFTMEDIINH